MITRFSKKATKKIMFLMKEIENREGTLEVQEELFRLEREKIIALESALVSGTASGIPFNNREIPT
jgi:hypothetical protein